MESILFFRQMVVECGTCKQACSSLKLDYHHIHSHYEKSIIIERILFCIKDKRAEMFDDDYCAYETQLQIGTHQALAKSVC
jgi:hypothetical protein